MIHYKDPVVELVPDAVSLDLAIQKIQEKLSALAWLQKAFGKAFRQTGPAPLQSREESGNRGRDITFPEVYNNREPLSLMINDNLKSYCFFHINGAMRFPSWEHFTKVQAAVQPISIIFWLNLEKIDPTKKYNFAEILRGEVLNVLSSCPGLTVEESETDISRVFAPYTITDTFKQFLKPPFAAFRFNGELRFDYSTLIC
jgi:hypothetical protein